MEWRNMIMSKNKLDLAYYKSLPYRRKIYPEIDDNKEKYFIGEIVEIPDCVIDGDTPSQANYNLDIAFDEYILSRLEMDYEIPLPSKIITSTPGRKQKILDRGYLLEDEKGSIPDNQYDYQHDFNNNLSKTVGSLQVT